MYLTGMCGQNMIYNIVNTGLYFYFQNVICLPAVALGWIFAIARVWDAINDPMMGVLVDHTKTKWGKCKPYLMFIPFVILVVTIAGFLNVAVKVTTFTKSQKTACASTTAEISIPVVD